MTGKIKVCYNSLLDHIQRRFMNDYINDMVLKIFHAFEDLYFEKGKGKIFDDIFRKYFPLVEIGPHMDVYDVLMSLGTKNRTKFDEIVRELRLHSLISG